MRIAHLDGDPYVHIPLPTKEPLCAVCEQPIMWHLDMFSMLNMADRRLVHARCVWTQEAFLREASRHTLEKATADEPVTISKILTPQGLAEDFPDPSCPEKGATKEDWVLLVVAYTLAIVLIMYGLTR